MGVLDLFGSQELERQRGGSTAPRSRGSLFQAIRRQPVLWSTGIVLTVALLAGIGFVILQKNLNAPAYRLASYSQQLKNQRATIDTLTARINAQQAVLDRETADMEKLKASGKNEAFNASVDAYNLLVTIYQKEYAAYQESIAAYDSMAAAANALATQNKISWQPVAALTAGN